MKKVIFFIVVLFFFNNAAFAQITGAKIFLPGHWVEIGIAPNGSWGAGAPMPTGYHPAPGLTNIGSVYDYGHDGWTVGTPPFFGDFMAEGTPFEGWSMQANSSRSDAFFTSDPAYTGTAFVNQTAAVSALTGANATYTNSGGVITAVWQGATTGTGGGLSITQTTILDTNASWAVIHVSFVNTSVTAIPGVYYWRTLDPDGDESAPGGSFATNNYIVYQNDALHRVMASATGTVFTNAYTALGTKDCRAKAMIYVNWYGSGAGYPTMSAGNSLDNIWAGTATGLGSAYYAAGTSQPSQDIAIGLIFNLGTIAPGDSAVFSYTYAFSANAAIDSAFPEPVIFGPSSLCVGSTITLTDSASYGAWSSSNTAVATVTPNTGVVSGVAAGTTTISYAFPAATCRTAYTHTVTVTNGVAPIIGPSTVCTGSVVNYSDATAGGTWSSSNTSVATIDSTGTLTGFSTGTTNLTYAIGGGCITTTSVSVGAITPVISGDTVVCIGTTINLSSTPSGGTWASSNGGVATVNSGTGAVRGVSTGTAVITYGNACGLTTTTVTVKAPPGPITTGPFYNPCTGYFSGLNEATTGGTWSSSNTNVATMSSDTLYEGSVPGISVISYSNGCGTATFTQTVSSRPMTMPGIPIGAAAIYLCLGGTTTLSNDGTPVGTWSSSNTNVATIDPTTGFVSSTGIAGTTNIVASNLCGGENIALIVSSPGTITGITTVCQGATTTLSDPVSGGTWTSGSPGFATVTPSGGVVTGVATGTAVITYSIAGGCFTTATVTVDQSPVPIAGGTDVCSGATTTLSDSPAGGTWSSSATGIATISGSGVVTGVSQGTSIISYTLTGGCAASTTVTVYPSPSAITGPTSVCTGSSVTLSDAVGGGTWSSSNTSIATITPADGIVTGNNAGVVIITYTTGGTCFTTYTVTVNLTPTVTTGSPNICTDGTTLLTGTPAGGVWTSSNSGVATIHTGTGSDTVAGVFSGNTVITYTLAGCSSSTTVTVVSFLPDITGPSMVCTGQTIVLNNTVIGGTWSSANTTVATVDPASGTVTGVAVGDTAISYTIGGSCITTATVMVNLSPYAGIIMAPANICVGTTVTISDTVSGGVWAISNGNATLSGDSVVGVLPGIDTITYSTTSLFCGSATDTAIIAISIPPYAGSISGDTIVCYNATITLSDSAGGGVWSSSNTVVATISGTGVVHPAAVGITTISYTVTNACSTAIATYTVTVFPLPAISAITGQDTACPGATFMLSDATAGGHWSNTNPSVLYVDSIGQVGAFVAGTSVVSYTTGPNAGQCLSVRTYTVTITFQGNFIVDSTITPVTCYGASNGSISLGISGTQGYEYIWNNGSSSTSLTGLPPGYDTVSIKANVTQCLEVLTFHVPGPDSLQITDTSFNDTCNAAKGSASVTVTGGKQPYTYLWSNSKTTSVITDLVLGVYSVTVTDSNGCTKSISVTVHNDSCGLVIHNAITPNGDGINDTWVIEGIGDYPKNTVQVFDKWGDLVYEKSNYDNSWDGKGKGHEVPDGTYYYLVKLNEQNLKGGSNVFTGYLMIKR